MKTLMNTKALSISIAAFYFLILSCSFVQANLVSDGALQLEVLPSVVKISSVRVNQEKDKLEILGELSQEKCDAECVHGHVDIALFSSAKKLLNKTSVNYGKQKHHQIRRGGHSHNKPFERDFKAEIPTVLSAGATLKIAFHNIPLAENTTDCGFNLFVE